MLHVNERCVCSFFLLWRNPQLLRLTLLSELSPSSSGIQHPVAMGTHPATPWEPLELISEEAAGEELGL